MPRLPEVPIPGYEGFYLINTAGRITSLARTVRRSTGEMHLPRRTLRHIPDRYGSPYVTLANSAGVHRRCSVAVLVLETFTGPRPEGAVAHNLSDKKQDVAHRNLIWASHEVLAALKKDGGGHWRSGYCQNTGCSRAVRSKGLCGPCGHPGGPHVFRSMRSGQRRLARKRKVG